MNIQKAVAVSALALLTAAPLTAMADSGRKATQACIQAFVDTYVPKGRTVRLHVVEPPESPLHAFPRQYTIALSARLARSGLELASARCVASPRGDVIVLDSPPLESYAAKADFVVSLQ